MVSCFAAGPHQRNRPSCALAHRSNPTTPRPPTPRYPLCHSDQPQPKKAEKELISTWAAEAMDYIDCTGPRDPGHLTIHRLNRNEYNNTIRDLVAVDYKPADDFPADDTGYGFDNIGDVLSMSPLLAEKYLSAAEQILDKAIQSGNPYAKKVKRFTGIQMEPTVGQTADSAAWNLSNNGELFKKYDFPTG